MTNEDYITGQQLGETLLASAQQMNAGLGVVVHSPVLAARQKSVLPLPFSDSEIKQPVTD